MQLLQQMQRQGFSAALPFCEQLQKIADGGRADAPVDSAEDGHLSELELLCADAEERCVLASAWDRAVDHEFEGL
jgi:hypothetical protein